MIKGSASGARHHDLFVAIATNPAFTGLPSYVDVADKGIPSTADWRARVLKSTSNTAAFWEDSAHNTLAGFSYLPASDLIIFTIPVENSAAAGIAFIEALPFEVAVLTSPFDQAWYPLNKPRWGFARTHVLHGWACAFRGAGHDRLVSRRWLDFGPWRVIRRPDDTTFIQFHDLAITDPEEAYAQAGPGHQRMGTDPSGGFIQGINQDAINAFAKRCVFLPATRTLELPIAPKVDVSQYEMWEGCALRLWSRLHAPAAQRIEHLVFVFMDKADAHRYLHELWLREIQCWYMDETGKHRIDADYHPTPTPPDWVRRLDAAAHAP